MTKVLHISASINGAASVSRELGDKLARKLADHHSADVVERDLSTNDVPLIDALRFEANNTAPEERSTAQAELAVIADELIDELKGADVIVFSVPIYNFSVPASVKAWADLVARAGTTFKYTENGPEGLLTGKKAYIAASSGGVPVGSEVDFMTKWLEHFLGFLGIPTEKVIAADGIMGENADEKIAEAHEKVEKLAA